MSLRHTQYGSDLNKICDECGAPLGEHMIGGPGPYHPRTNKPTSPVTSTRAGEEMIQATSIASEKVCDHPSTEKAAEVVAWQKRPLFGKVRIWTDCSTDPEIHSFWREQEYEVRPLYAAPPADQVIANPANSLRSLPESSEPSLLGRETVREAWKPTDAQVRSACLSYRHDFGLLSVSEAAIVKSEAREWLRAWQKEGAGADRNEIIELCAAIVDRANREGPYQAIAAASRIRALSLSPLKE